MSPFQLRKPVVFLGRLVHPDTSYIPKDECGQSQQGSKGYPNKGGDSTIGSNSYCMKWAVDSSYHVWLQPPLLSGGEI